MGSMNDSIEKVLFDEESIEKIVKRLGEQISRDYGGKKLLLVSVLKGSVVFMADLMRSITVPCEIDFMVVSSYGAGTRSSGNVKIVKDLGIDVKDYDLLIVEDILDSGVTLSTLKSMLEARHPASVRICTFFDKPERRVTDVKVDYTGFNIPDEFVVGYGLDYAQRYRNLPFIGVVEPGAGEE